MAIEKAALTREPREVPLNIFPMKIHSPIQSVEVLFLRTFPSFQKYLILARKKKAIPQVQILVVFITQIKIE
jgi:hypothetical protein